MDHLKAAFVEEANDLLSELEKSLLDLEKTADKKAIAQVFRVMHTLKGNSTMFGFDRIGDITHHLESIYDELRKEQKVLTAGIVNLTLATVDHLRHLIQDPDLNQPALRVVHEQLIRQIHEVTAHPDEISFLPATALPHDQVKQEAVGIKTYYILFRPKPEILQNGTHLLFLLEELHHLGPCMVHAHTRHIPMLEELEVARCYVHWDAYLATVQSPESIRELFIFVEEDCQMEVHCVGEGNLLDNEQFVDHLQQSGQHEQPVDIAQLQAYVNELLEMIRRKTLAEHQAKEEAQPTLRRENAVLPSIRVATEKVDELMNLVIEMVTTQARLSLLAENSHQPELLSVAENIEKITRRLRDSTFSISLVPFETLLTRFQRLVRDLSSELSKDILFITEGGETELDKNIIESLSDPLMHILRNSIDHGIEETALRLSQGKPRQGKILLKAFYSGNHVVIQVQDDGHGLDARKIREKAVSRGFIHAEVTLSEKDLFDLIFLPGFSTASQVTETSGRGVGMDMVKRRITDMRGELDIASKAGEGTTLTIRLPLTVSIIDGLLVSIAHTKYVIPLAVTDKCYEVPHHKLVGQFNNLLVLDGEQVPFYYLRDAFKEYENCPAIEQAVLVHYEGKRVGLVIDTIIGQYQAVLKPLGTYYRHQQFMSGATILGDGTVALVMDPHQIIRQLSRQEQTLSIY